jgi:hypothetical protein
MGKSVLMIDNNNQTGGAWGPLDIFGLHDVENAIHYFLQDQTAFKFMRRYLGWNVVKTEKKYRVFHKPFLGIAKLPYDNIIGRFISRFLYENIDTNVLKRLFLAIKYTFTTLFQHSVYVEGGSVEIIQSLRNLVEKLKLRIILQTQIINIKIMHSEGVVYVTTITSGESEKKIFKCGKIFLPHGAVLDKLEGDLGDIILNNKVHPRPAVHLLINDSSPSNVHELIFMNNPIIKYVHDITKFVREAENLKGRKKVLVFALRHNINEHSEIYKNLLALCEKNGMVGSQAFIEAQKWWNIFLPTLDDCDLLKINTAHHPLVECLYTDNFTKGIGLNSTRWATAMKNL